MLARGGGVKSHGKASEGALCAAAICHDPALQAFIDDTECRWGEDITDEESARLAAAGDPTDGRRLPAPEDLRQ